MSQESWREVLRTPEKCLLVTYLHIMGPGQNTVAYYTNESDFAERLTAIFLDTAGISARGYTPVEKVLQPGEGWRVDAAEYLTPLGLIPFSGSIMLVSRRAEESHLPPNIKDLVSTWWSPTSSMEILVGGLPRLNLPGEKEKKSYYMFCPAVEVNEKIKTLQVTINYSTDPDYADTATFAPRLHGLNGQTIEGPEVSIPPFGTAVLDPEQWFGEPGRALLAANGGRCSMTAVHLGHTLVSLFFHADRLTNDLQSGTHTQPPVICLFFSHPRFNYWAAWLGAHVPFAGVIFPILGYLKRNPKTFSTLYPHHSGIVGSWWAWWKQSRWVIYIRMMVRGFFLLLRSGFKVKQVDVSPDDQHNQRVMEYNMLENLKMFQFSRDRVEKFLYPLKSIPSINMAGRTLSIGPKNEGETLLLQAHGFTDVIGIDLFSYSPRILPMDVHTMTFADNTFDTIICSAVVKYFYDLPRAVVEIIRVAKDGALLVFGFGVGVNEQGESADKAYACDFITTHLEGGVPELLQLFGTTVGHIYWWSDDVIDSRVRGNLVIFKLKKENNSMSTENSNLMLAANRIANN